MPPGNQGFSDGDIQSIIAQQAQANRVNTITPFGSIKHTIDQGGSRNDNKVKVTLSPEQQALLQQQQAGQLLAGQQGAAQLGDLTGGRDAVEAAYFQRALGLLNPEFDRRERALQQRLANQGLPQASEAYGSEYGRFERGVNQQLEQAALAAILQGGQEQSRQTGNALGLLGMVQPQMPQQLQMPQITVPVQQPGGGQMNPLTGALTGAAGLSGLGPWGAAAGGGLGLLSAFMR